MNWTKEEILKKHGIPVMTSILNAMDEWEAQQIIAFRRWMVKRNQEVVSKSGPQSLLNSDMPIEDLIKQFKAETNIPKI